MSGRIRVFIASSLDGFIAGPNDELDWLTPAPHAGVEDTFTPFFQQIGALLMGRRTYDVVTGLGGDWPYGGTPVLVASHRPLPEPGPPEPARRVRGVSGSIAEMLAQARDLADGRDVYLDGGDLIRQALDAGLVDELTVTVIPMILGAGRPLFAGVGRRHALELVGQRGIGGGLVELVYELACPAVP